MQCGAALWGAQDLEMILLERSRCQHSGVSGVLRPRAVSPALPPGGWHQDFILSPRLVVPCLSSYECHRGISYFASVFFASLDSSPQLIYKVLRHWSRLREPGQASQVTERASDGVRVKAEAI